MKKLLPIGFLILFLLTGCTSGKRPELEQYTWRMATAQGMVDGQVIACAPGQTGVPDTAVEIILTCTAEDGVLTLSDQTNGQTCTGTYTLADSASESTSYKILIGETEGMAVVAETTYHDGSSVPTFLIRIGDYALNFFAGSD